MKLKLHIAKIMDNKNSGGGYILPLSREKSRLIKTPLKYNLEWNAKVNQCETIEDINKLKLEKDEKVF